MISKSVSTILIFISFPFFLFSSEKLNEIEKQFSSKGIVISNSINEKVINNKFSLYSKITNRTTFEHFSNINVANVVFPDVMDYYNFWFRKEIIFNKVVFNKTFDFTLSKCDSSANFYQSSFLEAVKFSWVIFNGDLNMSRSKFYDNVEFVRTYFNGYVDFFKSRFNNHIDFYGVKIKKGLNFSNSQLVNGVDLSFSDLYGDISFRNAELGGEVYFNNSQINNNLDFTGCKFDSLLDLSNSSINSNVLFSNSTLPSFMDLSNIRVINNLIDLTDVKTNLRYKVCRLNLVNTDISKIKLRYDNFKLWFPKNTSYEIKCNVYDAMLTVFKNNGYSNSYKNLDIEYQKFKYQYNNQLLNNFIQEIWWNYGYNKEKIFSWIIWITFVLTFINTIFIKYLMGNVYEMNFLNYDRIIDRNKLHHPVITFFLNIPTGFLYTIILLMGGAFGMRFNAYQIKLPNFLGLMYIISIGLLGISCSAFILNFIFEL